MCQRPAANMGGLHGVTVTLLLLAIMPPFVQTTTGTPASTTNITPPQPPPTPPPTTPKPQTPPTPPPTTPKPQTPPTPPPTTPKPQTPPTPPPTTPKPQTPPTPPPTTPKPQTPPTPPTTTITSTTPTMSTTNSASSTTLKSTTTRVTTTDTVTTETTTAESTTLSTSPSTTTETTPNTTSTSSTPSTSTSGPPTTTTDRPVPSNVGMIVGVVIASLVIFAFCGFVLFRYWRTGSIKKIFTFKDDDVYQPVEKPHGHQRPQPPEEDTDSYPRSLPIRVAELPDKYIELSSNSGLPFRKQYLMLSRLSPRHAQTAACIPENQTKNRYTDILPFDHNRVHLNKLEDEENSDYVNASFIPGYRYMAEYIACQGPTENSVNDHWRMIWEQNVRVIVMVTKCEEGDLFKREKCLQYWPDKESAPMQFGGITVSLLSSEKHCRDNYKIRQLDVRNGVETRIVYHFQYMRWPDKQNPEDPEGLLEYREAIRDTMMQFEDGPIIVHCSAGVGRSGTYIAVDTLLQTMEDREEVDVYALVLRLRNNRVLMVQTEAQYMFVHQCLLLSMDNKKKQEVADGHIYNNMSEDEYNPYENVPMAKGSGESNRGRKSLFSSGSRKRKSKVVGSKYVDKNSENEEQTYINAPPIPMKPRTTKVSDNGQINNALSSSQEFLAKNSDVKNEKPANKENGSADSNSGGDPPAVSQDAIILVD